MEQAKIDRINALARLAQERELTEAEQVERQTLREEYIAAYRQSLTQQLEHTYIVDKDGTKHKLHKKSAKETPCKN